MRTELWQCVELDYYLARPPIDMTAVYSTTRCHRKRPDLPAKKVQYRENSLQSFEEGTMHEKKPRSLSFRDIVDTR